MTLFCSCHAQKNAFALFVGFSFREIAIGLRGLDFRLPVAPCSIDRLAMILWLRCHAELKLKEGRFPIGRRFRGPHAPIACCDWRPHQWPISSKRELLPSEKIFG